MEYTKCSGLTGKTHTLFIPGLTQDMIDSYNAGALIQDAFDGISPEFREFIMTGITPEEWNTFLPPEPEEDEDYE